MKRRKTKNGSDFLRKQRKKLNIVLLLAAFLLTAFAVATGSYITDKETVSVGMVSAKRYVAPRDIVDEKATEKLREEARESVGVLYSHDTDIEKKALRDIRDFFDELNDAFTPTEEDSLDYVTSPKTSLKIPVALTSEQYYAYFALSNNKRESLKDDIYDIADYVFKQGITDETMDKAMDLALEKLEELNLNDNLTLIGEGVLSATLTPNLVVDNDAMEVAREYKASQVEPVMVLTGQKIVDEGEVITEDIYALLNDLNLINVDYSAGALPIAGAVMLTLIVFIAAAVYLKFQQRELLEKTNNVLIIFTSYMITLAMLFVLSGMSEYYFIPLYIFPVFVSIMVGAKAAVILNAFMCIAATFVFNGSVDFLMYFLITGSFFALIVRYTRRRRNIISVALGGAAVNFVSVLALKLFVEGGYSAGTAYEALFAALAGIITVMIAVGSLPIWEAVFKIDTPYRLLEFTNPNNELLKRLMIEAPGTYHHSLIVANLAETAAYDVFADGNLARAGAYYHDIGKLHNPQCFAENQNGKNVHDTLPPEESCNLILEHAIYGMELARQYKLPKAISDFICSHHGASLVKFFYFKAAKENPDVDESFFRYPGPIPQSRETAIVMLADTVEAAVRSIISSGKSNKEVEEIIARLIKDKLDDGQLDDCGLNIRELRQIGKSFMKVFNGMYHDRIVYPDEDELKKMRK